jgi:hypothetical protein
VVAPAYEAGDLIADAGAGAVATNFIMLSNFFILLYSAYSVATTQATQRRTMPLSSVIVSSRCEWTYAS